MFSSQGQNGLQSRQADVGQKNNPLYLAGPSQAASNRLVRTAPPPVPPRLSNSGASTSFGYPSQTSYGNYGGYGGLGRYGGIGSYSGYGGIGGYNSYGTYGGGYGSPYGGFGNFGPTSFHNPMLNSPESRFIQLAENSVQPTFQSIENLIQAFRSVSHMLDSTFYAIYSSFRAVLGVADQFGRLRTLFTHLFLSLKLISWFKWFIRKFLFTLRLSQRNPNTEQVWNDAVGSTVGKLDSIPGGERSSWPAFIFMGFILSSPYIVYKLFASSDNLKSNMYDSHTWYPDNKRPIYVAARYAFKAQAREEISFSVGDVLKVAPSSLQKEQAKGWILAENTKGEVGYIPLNYVEKIKNTNRTTTGNLQQETGNYVPGVHNASHTAHQVSPQMLQNVQNRYQQQQPPRLPDSSQHSGLASQNYLSSSPQIVENTIQHNVQRSGENTIQQNVPGSDDQLNTLKGIQESDLNKQNEQN